MMYFLTEDLNFMSNWFNFARCVDPKKLQE
jgi:hypothetical protein